MNDIIALRKRFNLSPKEAAVLHKMLGSEMTNHTTFGVDAKYFKTIIHRLRLSVVKEVGAVLNTMYGTGYWFTDTDSRMIAEAAGIELPAGGRDTATP